jgi:hypothetical protein
MSTFCWYSELALRILVLRTKELIITQKGSVIIMDFQIYLSIP